MSEKLIARLTRVSPYTVRRVISSLASIIRHQPTTLPSIFVLMSLSQRNR